MGHASTRIESSVMLPSTESNHLLTEYVSRGMVLLGPEQLDIDAAVHKQIYAAEKIAFHEKRRITAELIPEVLEVLAAPGLVGAVDQLLGPDWAIVPFTHNTPFVSGAFDQHWHKDDNGPFNGRRQRHHHPVQLEMLYYPQDVAMDMGPTAVIPYSQYWTFNHEENHDNFAGADHLDFNYQLTGMETVPVSGRRSRYDETEIRTGTTAHDQRMRDAVNNLGWPLVKPFEAGPLAAGSVILYSHNLFHRGNHRRDPWENWKPNPRFMWRFWLYRTTDPASISVPGWQRPARDVLTDTDLSDLNPSIENIWRQQYQWALCGQPPDPDVPADEADELLNRIQLAGDEQEPQRIAAAYRLAALTDQPRALTLLSSALQAERESIRRAATYGLIAMGSSATGTFEAAAQDPRRWVKKAGMHGLGEVAPLTGAVLSAIEAGLTDASAYVRANAAGAVAGLVRRAVANHGDLTLVPRGAECLLDLLVREQNRLGMDRAQQRSIKFVRPTDESDICEGIGIDYGVDRFQPVRSAVRETALTSLVVICTHGSHLGGALSRTVSELAELVQNDQNLFSVGLALDALNRLAGLAHGYEDNVTLEDLARRLPRLAASSPIHCLESLHRGGQAWQNNIYPSDHPSDHPSDRNETGENP